MSRSSTSKVDEPAFNVYNPSSQITDVNKETELATHTPGFVSE